MNKFDKKMKELTKNIEVPASYDEKVDKVLLEIMKKDTVLPEEKKSRRWLPRLAVFLICIICAISLYTIDTHANIFSFFKESILNFLGRGNDEEDIEDMGVESEKLSVESKADLMLEMQELVVDNHSFYLLVKMTASSDIRFEDDVLFDYFCFCRGANYNVNELIGGAISCELLEVSEDFPNIATYVVSLVFDEDLEEGCEVTACFKDLTKAPYSSDPELLLEGIWSLTFDNYPTVTDYIAIEGTPDMTFPYINTTAVVKKIELTPLGIVVCADVSPYSIDELYVSDTTIAVGLEMIDGTKLTVVSHDPEKEEEYVRSGMFSYLEEEGKTYQQVTLEFPGMLNIAKVVGVYIEDLYIPVE